MMAWIKRITLFLFVNFLVVIAISFLLWLFNVQPFLTRHGLSVQTLAVFCLIWGMGGAFISLALSKLMAKWMMGVRIIDPSTQNSDEKAVLEDVYELAKKAGLPAMPEVGIYASPELNAFATGPTKRNALVAVSSGLLQRMSTVETKGVLGHEIAHIANGDMVTMTLLQGVVNAFVMFLARALAYGASNTLSRDRQDSSSFSMGGSLFYVFVFIFEFIFMLLGSIVVAHFSRFREFRADAGGARLAGRESMIAALRKLQATYEIHDMKKDPPSFQAMKISSSGSFLRLFATHPPLEERIRKLSNLTLER